MNGSKRVVGPLSSEPSAFTEAVIFTHPGGDAELRCLYERGGSKYSGGLHFYRVRAYRFRAEGHCTPWHIEQAYDTLVEIEQSEWVDELLAAEPSETWGHWTIRHFLIFLDGAGAYEVAAENVEWLQEEPVS
jgi:hypothetical protein